LINSKNTLTASFSESVLELFAGRTKPSATGLDQLPDRLDKPDHFLGPDKPYSEVDSEVICPDGCNAFFDVIVALEDEAARLQLNLLATTLEYAMDACLMEQKRLRLNADPFLSGFWRAESTPSPSSSGRLISFKSARVTQELASP
jgi:hypothetical protein